MVGTIKTRPTGEDVTAFLESVPNERRRAEGLAVRALMERVTGAPATMWGPSMVGFGSMMIASHRGLYSVGLVLVIGVGSCLLVSLVMLPSILTLLDRMRGGDVSENEGANESAPKKAKAKGFARVA